MLLALTACSALPGNDADEEVSPDASGSPAPGEDVISAEDGYAQGYLGDTMRTVFFDFSVDSAYTCAELESYTPPDGLQLLVVDITIKNTSTYSMPMFDNDFQAQWGSTGDEDFSIPITRALVDNQAPASYEIPIDGTVTYTPVFEVPADAKDFSISFLEYFTDDTEGDVFFVYFTAE